jgi:hypothetical protein
MNPLLELFHPRLRADFTDIFDEAVAILAVEFNNWQSEVPDATPDRSNAIVAEAVGHIYERVRLPTFLQSEHAVILQDRITPIVYPTHSGMHVQTQQFLSWAAREVLSLGNGNKVIIVCHPDHSWRIACLARYYGLDPIFPHECLTVPYARCIHPGDQWWTRVPWFQMPDDVRKPWHAIGFKPWEYCIARPGTLALWALRKL